MTMEQDITLTYSRRLLGRICWCLAHLPNPGEFLLGKSCCCSFARQPPNFAMGRRTRSVDKLQEQDGRSSYAHDVECSTALLCVVSIRSQRVYSLHYAQPCLSNQKRGNRKSAAWTCTRGGVMHAKTAFLRHIQDVQTYTMR